MSKKLEEKQRRRLAKQTQRERQKRAARRSNLITLGIAAVIVGLVTVGIMTSKETEQKAPPAPAGVAASEAGCGEIEEHEIEGSNHVEAGNRVDYETSPPTSGDHWPPGNEADPGFYPTEVPSESLVHNMEHGQIVIWYRPDAPQEVRDNIQGLVESANDSDNPQLAQGGAPPLLAVPFDGIEGPNNLAITAWGASQSCKRYSLEAIDEFRQKYQGQGPEEVTAPFEP